MNAYFPEEMTTALVDFFMYQCNNLHYKYDTLRTEILVEYPQYVMYKHEELTYTFIVSVATHFGKIVVCNNIAYRAYTRTGIVGSIHRNSYETVCSPIIIEIPLMVYTNDKSEASLIYNMVRVGAAVIQPISVFHPYFSSEYTLAYNNEEFSVIKKYNIREFKYG